MYTYIHIHMYIYVSRNGTLYILKYLHTYICSFIVFLSLTPDSFAAGFTSGDGEVRIQIDGRLLVSDDPSLLIPRGHPNSCGCMHATTLSIILCSFGDGYMMAT